MKVLIIGGVAGGAGTAARLRRIDENAEIILFEKGEFISFANCGMPYYIGNEIKNKKELLLQTPESFWNRFHVEVRTGHEVLSVNTRKRKIEVQNRNGIRYEENYDKLVLSPGAVPVKPSIPIAESAPVFLIRDLPDTYRIYNFIQENKPTCCAVIGGGFIGLEMAENLSHRGIKVTLVEAGDHLMPALDLDMAQEIHNTVRKNGVSLYLGKKCCKITCDSVILDEHTSIPVDFAVMSVGIRPQTDFLKGSDVELGMRGEILVNEYMETSAEDVYALGDAVAVRNIVSKEKQIVSLASPAARQSRTVAGEIAGRRQSYQGTQGTSVLRLYDKVAASTGLTEKQLIKYRIPYKKSFTYSCSHAGYYPGASMMLIKLLFDPEKGIVLGAQIVGGEGVDKRIDVLACAVRSKLTVYELQDQELAYAPPFSSSKDPVNMAGYVAGNILDEVMVPFYVDDLESLPTECEYIDVRTAGEFENGTIPGFRNIPLDSLRDHLDEIDKNKTVYVTCQIGLRGYLAQRILVQNGYKVFNLAGGYRLYNSIVEDRRMSGQNE